jgi:hypothetical protein
VLKEVKSHSLRILDFDIENMPLSYNGQDFTTAQITAIAASWADKKRVHCWVLGEVTYREMIENFLELYDQADSRSGHSSGFNQAQRFLRITGISSRNAWYERSQASYEPTRLAYL